MTSMKNKRRKGQKLITLINMEKSVQPLNVSPVIKATRCSLLLLGIFYGMQRRKTLTKYEAKARKIRETQNRELERKKQEEIFRQFKGEIEDMAREFEIKELPPNWDSNV